MGNVRRQTVTEQETREQQEIRERAKRIVRISKSMREAERDSGLSRAMLLSLASDARVPPATFALARERFHGPAAPVSITHQADGLMARKP